MVETTHAGLVHLGGHVFAHPDLEPLLTDVDSLRTYDGNPRKGDTSAVAESIRTNGMYRPVFVQRSTASILAGNHTYAAAVDLGATRVPAVWLDVTDEQARRIVAADNRTADLGGYDDRALVDLLTELGTTDDGLIGTGYTADDLDDLTLLLSRAEPPDLDSLAAEVGEPAETDGWVTVSFKVPPELSESWNALVREHDGDPVSALETILSQESETAA